ncbi:ChaN family lipoprotein [Stappia sp.]|uniref:ChaN family lipoprotein n=1 Tax=Stappia sp. TaxID=1870903 RepID=UPI0032D8D938
MIRVWGFLLVVAMLLTALPTRAQVPAFLLDAEGHPLAGRVWATRAQAFVPPETVAQAVRDADFALLGEIHDNPDHHLLQAHLVAEMTGEGRIPALVLEMLPRDRQERVDAHVASAPGDAARFGEAVGWADLGWPDYAMYRPILESALAARLPVVAGDTPREERRRVGRQGLEALGAETLARLALDEPLDAGARARLDDVLFDGHCGLMPRAALSPMAGVQRLRDARLAEAMIASAADGADGAVLIAGSGHVRADFGVPVYLARLAPDASTVTVGFVEVRADATRPAAYAEAVSGAGRRYDYVWFTPRAERGDPCAGLKERFGNAAGDGGD